jgi:hypothetical protein
VGVFLAIERLDAGRVEALDQFFHQDRLNVLVGDELGNCGERNRFVVVEVNREPHVDCGVDGWDTSWVGHQKRPLPQGSQLLLNSRGLCDTTNAFCFKNAVQCGTTPCLLQICVRSVEE